MVSGCNELARQVALCLALGLWMSACSGETATDADGGAPDMFVAADATASDGTAALPDTAALGDTGEVLDTGPAPQPDAELGADGGAALDLGEDLGTADSAVTLDFGPPDAGLVADTGPMGDAGPCGVCVDNNPCTRETCLGTMCLHVPDHTRCAAGSYCGATGCVAAPRVCSAASPCPANADPCIVATCSVATAQCVYRSLDNDGDGFAPTICGGEDCNDASAAVKPGALEDCNGIDDDCNGGVDDFNRLSSVCGGPGGAACVNGRCACRPGWTRCNDMCWCRPLPSCGGIVPFCFGECVNGQCVNS